MSQVKINVKEAKDLLKYTIKNNIYLQSIDKKPVTLSLIGDAGIGKTALCKQSAVENGLVPVFLSLSQLDELGDLLGIPSRQFQLCKTSSIKMVKKQVMEGGKLIMKDMPVEGDSGETECIWVDESAIDQYTKSGYTFTGNKKMVYAEPEWIQGIDSGVLLILDDITRCQTRFLQAVMELIQNQEYMTWKLPKGSTIVTTENPDNGQYHVESQDLAMTSRRISFELVSDVNTWAEWAERDGIIGLG